MLVKPKFLCVTFITPKVLSHLSGFLSGLVFGHGEAMTQVEVEVQQRAVLQAQSFQRRAVDLRRQVAEKQPCGSAPAAGAP